MRTILPELEAHAIEAVHGTFQQNLEERNKIIERCEKAKSHNDERAVSIHMEQIKECEAVMNHLIGLHIRAGWQLTDNMKAFEPYADSPEKEDWNGAMYTLADDLRYRRDKGEFETYREAYQSGENNYTVSGKPVTAKQLENNYHKAKASGLLD